MTTFNALIDDLTSNSDLLRDLASKLMVTEPGEWQTLNQHLKSMGYEIELQSLKGKIKEVAITGEQKANDLIQKWYQHVE